MHHFIHDRARTTLGKGFLLIELLLALCMLMITISSVAVYQAHTYALCADAKKRDEAINITNTVIETLHATRAIPDSYHESNVQVTIKPVALGNNLLLDPNWSTKDHLMFLDIETRWRLTSGVPTSFHTSICMQAGER